MEAVIIVLLYEFCSYKCSNKEELASLEATIIASIFLNIATAG